MMLDHVDQVLTEVGVVPGWQPAVKMVLVSGLVLCAFFVLRWLLMRVAVHFCTRAYRVSRFSFFNHLITNRVPFLLGVFAPVVILKAPVLVLVGDYPPVQGVLDAAFGVVIIVLMIGLFIQSIQSAMDMFREQAWFEARPVESYMQVVKIIGFVIGTAMIFSQVTGRSPTTFFAAMGAASAVLLLMFRDTIMGFVASIQVTTNDMVRLGDWITMNKYGADGDVIQITLTTVKVQNFDKTITTIPTYALISDSFQNWRGMSHSGGRRIKRAIQIKQSSIRYIRDDELAHFRLIQGIREYVDERSAEIDAYNREVLADRTIPVNGRNMTNAGLFRRYAFWYISNHPGINKNMTCMVRQLAPVPTGLPFEIYAFTRTVVWTEYEEIMADIFDHLIAAVPFFHLQIFEERSGGDRMTVRLEDTAMDAVPMDRVPVSNVATQ